MRGIGTKEIRTERLLLRRFRMEDADAAWENIGSDPLVSRYISFAPFRTRESTEAFLRMHEESYRADPHFYGWAVTLDGEVIGSASLFHVDPDADSCELGYSLGSPWWGRGYMTEVVSALVAYAFEEMGAHRVYGSHHLDNLASGRVMEKAGLRREGVLRGAQKNRDGSYSDLALYGMVSTDREKSAALPE